MTTTSASLKRPRLANLHRLAPLALGLLAVTATACGEEEDDVGAAESATTAENAPGNKPGDEKTVKHEVETFLSFGRVRVEKATKDVGGALARQFCGQRSSCLLEGARLHSVGFDQFLALELAGPWLVDSMRPARKEVGDVEPFDVGGRSFDAGAYVTLNFKKMTHGSTRSDLPAQMWIDADLASLKLLTPPPGLQCASAPIRFKGIAQRAAEKANPTKKFDPASELTYVVATSGQTKDGVNVRFGYFSTDFSPNNVSARRVLADFKKLPDPDSADYDSFHPLGSSANGTIGNTISSRMTIQVPRHVAELTDSRVPAAFGDDVAPLMPTQLKNETVSVTVDLTRVGAGDVRDQIFKLNDYTDADLRAAGRVQEPSSGDFAGARGGRAFSKTWVSARQAKFVGANADLKVGNMTIPVYCSRWDVPPKQLSDSRFVQR